MGILEVILLLAGAVLAVLSFVLPASKEETSRETKVLAKEEIKTMVDSEMNGIRNHVDDVVDEAVGYAVEKTERSLERLTNEKIMAVNEYSDTVLNEIHKNHEEAMFLYDMLNAKHDSLKNTVSEANKAVQEVQSTIESMTASRYAAIPEVQMNQEVSTGGPAIEVVEVSQPRIREPEFQRLDISMIAAEPAVTDERESATKKSAGKKTTGKTSTEKESATKKTSTRKKVEKPGVAEVIKEWDFLADVKEPGVNNNEQILKLHKQGKSTVAIAKELGLGVGEVKLVIELYKNA